MHGNGFFATPLADGLADRASAERGQRHVREGGQVPASSACSTAPTWPAVIRVTNVRTGHRRRVGSARCAPDPPRLLVAVDAVGRAGGVSAHGAVREYWIKAVNAGTPPPTASTPSGRVPLNERTLTAIVYRGYTRNWRKPLPNTARSGDNDGIPGPLIEARVGDRVIVHFKNEDRGLRPTPLDALPRLPLPPRLSDGAFIPQVRLRGGTCRSAGRGPTAWTAVPQSAGVWPYHDHSSSMMESIPHGLYGVISILGKNERPPDRRFVVAFASTLSFDSINGRAFIGNTPTFHAKVGETVEWDVIAMGENFHTFHVHGHRWLDQAGVPKDTQEIGPGGSFRVRWREDAPGTWYYHCHVEDPIR